MLDKDFLRKKLDSLASYIDKLEKLVFLNDNLLKSDDIKLAAIERYFQQTVDTMVDANTHIIKEGNFGTVDDLQSTFKLLGEFGVLDQKFATKIAPIVGVRNMLVHRYEKLDADRFLGNLRNNFPDLKAYLLQIDGYLDKV